jgi:metal-responsive CopG/Arc/MetJ family transcriptional regulator
MIRTQISLTEEQARRLQRVAAQRGVSMAAVIRDAVDAAVVDEGDVDRRERIRRALEVIGKYRSDGANVSENHDEFLAEIYGTW